MIGATFTAGAAAFDDGGLRTGGAGLVVGRNRQKQPVTLRPFRPAPTRMLVIGGVGCAQLLAFRALAIGARLFIQTAREQVWDAFLRRCGVGRETAAFLPPDSPPPIAATLGAPHLVIVDAGAAVGPPPSAGGPWQATLVVRDDLASWDEALLQQSDVVVLQRLTPAEAAMAASVLGIRQAQTYLPQLPGEMVGLVSRARLQWVMLSSTPTEQALLGSVARP
ncbi:hypothetical protein [Actinoplanes sp. RD1]|uniref:hypothetical protein n=1 Tax=Actinoplanes sp. RD1 TaxID=3064538 RepID=UPI002741F319|nr:hypothetical protein [Actinoplanes sp. RD1]